MFLRRLCDAGMSEEIIGDTVQDMVSSGQVQRQVSIYHINKLDSILKENQKALTVVIKTLGLDCHYKVWIPHACRYSITWRQRLCPDQRQELSWNIPSSVRTPNCNLPRAIENEQDRYFHAQCAGTHVDGQKQSTITFYVKGILWNWMLSIRLLQEIHLKSIVCRNERELQISGFIGSRWYWVYLRGSWFLCVAEVKYHPCRNYRWLRRMLEHHGIRICCWPCFFPWYPKRLLQPVQLCGHWSTV